jgi:hypothetical protein
MRLRRRRHVHDVWLRRGQHRVEVVEHRRHVEARRRLARDVAVAVAHRDDARGGDPPQLQEMRVGDLAASDERDSEILAHLVRVASRSSIRRRPHRGAAPRRRRTA